MEYKEQIHNYVNLHKAEIINTLKMLVSVPSVRSIPTENAPFGKSCADILMLTKKLYENNGFKTELDEKNGYLLSFYGNGEKSLGIFAHSDVVSVNNDWIHTDPFTPIEKDGYLIGRGVLDDKSAIVISVYCAKILKELKIPFNSKLIMFTGSSEETGMEDLDNYLAKHTAPDFSLICDAAFPVYRGDKSGLNFFVTLNSPLKSIETISGGAAMNITLGLCSAKINGEILTETGKSCHSALPEGSVNAGYLLAKRLLKRNDICSTDKKSLELILKILNGYYGEAFGIEHTDNEFGKLTCTNCIIKTENKQIILGFNMRYGISADICLIKQKLTDFFEKQNCTVNFEKEKTGYLVPENNNYIKKCIKAYSDFTGEINPMSRINAGGTYGRKLPCAAEIGTTLKWGVPKNTPSGHGGAHQPDECINIQGFLLALELTVQMLIECDKTEE